MEPTSCQIRVEGLRHEIYMYGDAYPETIIPQLQTVLVDFRNGIGWEPDSLSAHILFTLMSNLYDASQPHGVFRVIDTNVHFYNIRYLYTITSEWHIECGTPNGTKVYEIS